MENKNRVKREKGRSIARPRGRQGTRTRARTTCLQYKIKAPSTSARRRHQQKYDFYHPRQSYSIHTQNSILWAIFKMVQVQFTFMYPYETELAISSEQEAILEFESIKRKGVGILKTPVQNISRSPAYHTMISPFHLNLNSRDLG